MATADNPDPPITYDEFVELVLRYQRTPLLIRCQELAWAIWEKKPLGLSLNDEHICQAHLGTVAAIAAAEASELGRIEATTQDAISLCHQFLRIEERFLSSDRADTMKLGELLRSSEVFSVYDISDEAVGNAALRLFLGRLIRSQWDARVVAYRGIPRTWELLRRLYERLNGDLEARHARVLGVESREFMRAGIALFAQLQRSPKPGFIDVSKQTFEPGVGEALNLSVEALELVADRLARPVDELKAWQSYVGSLPDRRTARMRAVGDHRASHRGCYP